MSDLFYKPYASLGTTTTSYFKYLFYCAFGILIFCYVSYSVLRQSTTTSNEWLKELLSPSFFQKAVSPLLSANGIDYKSRSSSKAITNDGSDELLCKFPLLDPWDPSIKPILDKQNPNASFNCTSLQPYLTYITEDNKLAINATEYANLSASQPEEVLFCRYSRVLREPGSDNNVIVTSSKPLELGQPLTINASVVEVSCYQGKSTFGAKKIYYNVHPLIEYPSRNPDEFGNENPGQLSVLMIVLESTSLSAFRRNMPKTYRYMAETMGTTFFKGYNKVGDNTFPNVVPILSGLRVDSPDQSMPADVQNRNWREAQFDDWPIVWKNFRAKGYITGHCEDWPHFGVFNYYMGGFKEPPTDAYYRPFWLLADMSNLLARSSQHCFGNVPSNLIQLSIVRRFWKTFSGKLRFMFTFMTELSHDSDYDLGLIDGSMLKMLRYLNDEGHLNHTALFIAADHGSRYSALRQSLVGLIEERMPLFSLTLPDWFVRKHTRIRASLRTNQMRLTTPFDFHETLLDFANSAFSTQQRPLSSRGLSQLYEIPANRTCSSAGIPEQYCTCTEMKPANISDPLVILSANLLVDKLNRFLENQTGLCAKLSLKRILRAEIFVSNQQVLNAVVRESDRRNMTHKESQITQVRTAIEVEPSQATFEGLIEHDLRLNSAEFRGGRTDISRTNKYGSQSDCMTDVVLKKYCFCI